MLEIPLTNEPEQIFSIVANGEKFDVRVIFNSRAVLWSMSLSQNGVALVSGIALLPGVNIMEPYNLALQNVYVVNIENPGANPTFSGLGSKSRLFILNESELNIG